MSTAPTALEILNKHIDFSQDGIIEREKAIEAMKEYTRQKLDEYLSILHKEYVLSYSESQRFTEILKRVKYNMQ